MAEHLNAGLHSVDLKCPSDCAVCILSLMSMSFLQGSSSPQEHLSREYNSVLEQLPSTHEALGWKKDIYSYMNASISLCALLSHNVCYKPIASAVSLSLSPVSPVATDYTHLCSPAQAINFCPEKKRCF